MISFRAQNLARWNAGLLLKARALPHKSSIPTLKVGGFQETPLKMALQIKGKSNQAGEKEVVLYFGIRQHSFSSNIALSY